MKIAVLAAGLQLLVICHGGATGGVAASPGPEEAAVKRVVVEEALRAGFPPSLALAVADAASGFDAARRSRDGALGIMQLHPRTARHLGLENLAALRDARANAGLGIGYLAQLIGAQRGRLEPALAQMEQGVLPKDAGTSEAPTASPFVSKVMGLRQHYRAEAQSWADALKGAPVAWDRLRPNDHRLRRLAKLAREREGPQPPSGPNHGARDLDSEIERRRRAILPYLDDFSG